MASFLHDRALVGICRWHGGLCLPTVVSGSKIYKYVCVCHGRRVLRATEEGDLPACYQRSVQKPASLMVWVCISAYGLGSLHVLEGTMNAERYIKVLE